MTDREAIMRFKSLIHERIKAYHWEIVDITEKKIGPLSRIVEAITEEFPEPKSEKELLEERLAIAKAHQDAINSAVLSSVERFAYRADDDLCTSRIAHDAYVTLKNSKYAHFTRASESHENMPQVIREWIVFEMVPAGILKIDDNGIVVNVAKEPTP